MCPLLACTWILCVQEMVSKDKWRDQIQLDVADLKQVCMMVLTWESQISWLFLQRMKSVEEMSQDHRREVYVIISFAFVCTVYQAAVQSTWLLHVKIKQILSAWVISHSYAWHAQQFCFHPNMCLTYLLGHSFMHCPAHNMFAECTAVEEEWEVGSRSEKGEVKIWPSVFVYLAVLSLL